MPQKSSNSCPRVSKLTQNSANMEPLGNQNMSWRQNDNKKCWPWLYQIIYYTLAMFTTLQNLNIWCWRTPTTIKNRGLARNSENRQKKYRKNTENTRHGISAGARNPHKITKYASKIMSTFLVTVQGTGVDPHMSQLTCPKSLNRIRGEYIPKGD